METVTLGWEWRWRRVVPHKRAVYRLTYWVSIIIFKIVIMMVMALPRSMPWPICYFRRWSTRGTVNGVITYRNRSLIISIQSRESNWQRIQITRSRNALKVSGACYIDDAHLCHHCDIEVIDEALESYGIAKISSDSKSIRSSTKVIPSGQMSKVMRETL